MKRLSRPALAPARRASDPSRSLLLLEFVIDERWVFNSRFFPFLKGGAGQLGIPAVWLCFGSRLVLEKTGPHQVMQYIDLNADELAQLERIVSAHRPSHVIVSHPISAAIVASLRPGGRAVRVVSMSDFPGMHGVENLIELSTRLDPPATDRPVNRNALFARTGWFLNWLGVTGEDPALADRFLVDGLQPDYEAVIGNQAAREYRPHLIVMGGIACDHSARLDRNPHFQGVNLAGCEFDYGCAFCTWYRGPTSRPGSDPVATAMRQISQIIRTAGPDGRFRGLLDMHDIRLFRRLERFFSAVLASGLPPTTFFFEPRFDRFLQVAETLERLLPEIARSGHRVSLFRMGAETLVEEENALYNKCISLNQIDRATVRLRELAARFPTAFEYDPTMGYITCSPWTTLEMFERGIRFGIERGLEPGGVWLYTPILFFLGSPITRLAEAQGGILADEYEDLSQLYEPSINNVSFDTIRPWRFKDERTGIAFGAIVRFCAASMRRKKYPDTLFADDALYRLLLTQERSEDDFLRPDLFALEAISAVRAAGPPYDRQALLIQALESYRKRLSGMPTVEAAGSPSKPAPDTRLDAVLPPLRAALASLGTEIRPTSLALAPGGKGFSLGFEIRGVGYSLRLDRPEPGRRALFATERFVASHDPSTPPRSASDVRDLTRAARLADRLLARLLPEWPPAG